MGAAIKHPVPDWTLISGHSNDQLWASERPDVKSYKWRLNPLCHKNAL